MSTKDEYLNVRLDDGDKFALIRLENAMKKNRSDITRIAIQRLLDEKVSTGDVPPLHRDDDYDVLIEGIRNLVSKKTNKHVSAGEY
jgi:hypothetical protein